MAIGIKTINTNLFNYNTSIVIIISQKYTSVQQTFSNYTKIYTNALKLEHGIRILNVKDEISLKHELPKITSIFTAENYAMYEEIKLADILLTQMI